MMLNLGREQLTQAELGKLTQTKLLPMLPMLHNKTPLKVDKCQ